MRCTNALNFNGDSNALSVTFYENEMMGFVMSESAFLFVFFFLILYV